MIDPRHKPEIKNDHVLLFLENHKNCEKKKDLAAAHFGCSKSLIDVIIAGKRNEPIERQEIFKIQWRDSYPEYMRVDAQAVGGLTK